MADKTDDLDKLERVMRETIRELRENPAAIAAYVVGTELILRERARLLAATPECPVHGADCVPHAVEWINEQKREKEAEKAMGQRHYRADDGGPTRVPEKVTDIRFEDGYVMERQWQVDPAHTIKGITFSSDYATASRPIVFPYTPTKGKRARAYLGFALREGLEAGKQAVLCAGDVYRALRVLAGRG